MHIFLTGKKQVGKSTLLNKLLETDPVKTAGFYTRKMRGFLENGESVHLFEAGEPFVPGMDNLLFVCGRKDGQITERFERLGCRALGKCQNCSRIVLDELGPHEREAQKLRQKVLELLDGEIPVLGVLQAPAEEFWPEIVEHPGVRVIEITEENRQDPALVEEILGLNSGWC